MYAREAGYLDAYLLTARADEFPDERARWEEERPDMIDEYRAWYGRVFEGEPPGSGQTTGER